MSIAAKYHTYGVSDDGQRFLLFQRVISASASATPITPELPVQGLTVAMHWARALSRR